MTTVWGLLKSTARLGFLFEKAVYNSCVLFHRGIGEITYLGVNCIPATRYLLIHHHLGNDTIKSISQQARSLIQNKPLYEKRLD